MSKSQIQILFEKYKLNNDENAFIELYNLLEPLLKKVITDVTFIYEINIKRQKYHKIHEYEKRIGKKINMTKLMEKYKDEYIKIMYSEDYDRFKNPKYSLIYPFWELINKLTIEKVNKDIKKWNVSFEWYLATKFCDNYWLYIEKCLRRDFVKRKNYNKYKVISLDRKLEHISDSFLYKYGLYTTYDHTVSAVDLIDNFKTKLSNRENQVLELIIKGFSNKEIAKKLGISESNIAKIKNSIKSKLIDYIKV